MTTFPTNIALIKKKYKLRMILFSKKNGARLNGAWGFLRKRSKYETQLFTPLSNFASSNTNIHTLL